MGIRDTVAADNAFLLGTDEWADTLTLQKPDGEETSLVAIVFDVLTELRDINGIATIVSIRNITCATSDVPDLNFRGLIIISDEAWSINRIVYQDEWQTTVELQRHELHEHTRPRYRLQ